VNAIPYCIFTTPRQLLTVQPSRALSKFRSCQYFAQPEVSLTYFLGIHASQKRDKRRRVEALRLFRGSYRHHLQGRCVSQATRQHESGSKLCLLTAQLTSCVVLISCLTYSSPPPLKMDTICSSKNRSSITALDCFIF
jgi:hypothetical protein